MLAEAALALSVTLAAEKDFLHFPDAAEFRFQRVAKVERERDWPFSVDKGLLACVWGIGQRMTYFYEDPDTAEEEGRSPRFVVLSVNPFDLAFVNIANRDLFVASQTLEERLRLVMPFVTVAQRLCDQPPGAQVGSGEL